MALPSCCQCGRTLTLTPWHTMGRDCNLQYRHHHWYSPGDEGVATLTAESPAVSRSPSPVVIEPRRTAQYPCACASCKFHSSPTPANAAQEHRRGAVALAYIPEQAPANGPPSGTRLQRQARAGKHVWARALLAHGVICSSRPASKSAPAKAVPLRCSPTPTLPATATHQTAPWTERITKASLACGMEFCQNDGPPKHREALAPRVRHVLRRFSHGFGDCHAATGWSKATPSGNASQRTVRFALRESGP